MPETAISPEDIPFTLATVLSTEARRITLVRGTTAVNLFDPPIMLDSSGRMVPPTREQVEAVFLDLIDGRRSRDDVVRWAGQWVFGYPSRDIDPAVWDALMLLTMVDLITTDRPFLYVEEDFRSWLEEFREK